MTRFRWGIFGTGEISAKFVAGLAAARDAEASFVASRSLARAQHFAQATGIARAIEGYAEAARTGGVDAIYIATPPSQHVEHALACIAAGIPVLVEKPFATSADEARRIAEAARARSVFAMEAMWTRFLPAARALKEKVAAGAAGEVRLVQGSFASSQVPMPGNGNFDPALGGGALAHLGVYPLSLGQWLFGTPQVVRATARIGDSGVDEDVAFLLAYGGGITGSFFASIRAWSHNRFEVMGSEGVVSLQGPIQRPRGVVVAQAKPLRARQPGFGWKGKLLQHPMVHLAAQVAGLSRHLRETTHSHRYAGNGYNHEADEVRSCLERGAVESPLMPLADSLDVATTVDAIRQAAARP